MIRQDIQELIKDKLLSNSDEKKDVEKTRSELSAFVNELLSKYNSSEDLKQIGELEKNVPQIFLKTNEILAGDLVDFEKLEKKYKRYIFSQMAVYSSSAPFINCLPEKLQEKDSSNFIKLLKKAMDAILAYDKLKIEITTLLSSPFLNSDILTKSLPKSYKNLTKKK